MVVKSTLKIIIKESQDSPLTGYTKRDITLLPYLKTGSALALIGPRRSGKSTVCFQIMDELIAEGTDRTNFLYINFEDERLLGFTSADFVLLEEAYHELYGNTKPIFFLDEVHLIDKWWLFVRRLVDHGSVVVLTGSNSKLLSSEYATHIGGRAIEYEVLPFSFVEFVRLKGLPYNQSVFYSKDRSLLFSLSQEFLIWGGFPAIANSPKETKRDNLSSYIKSVVFQDVAGRYNISNTKNLEIVLGAIAQTVSSSVTYRGLSASLGATGETISHKTVRDYLSHFQNAYSLLPLSQLRKSYLKREYEKKWYFSDTGYLNLFFPTPDLSKSLENAVYLELRKSRFEVFYLKLESEIDFIVNSPSLLAIQVTFELNSSNRKRELQPLLNLDSSYKKLVVTMEQESESDSITVIPFWKFPAFLHSILH